MFREFKVGELFDINDTIKFNPRDNRLPVGNVPYITRTSKNNGQLDSYSDDSGQFTNKGNCITVGIEGAVAFYQPNDFIAGINVYTLRHERMTQSIGLYLCAVLNMQSWKYGFVNGRTLGRIKAETIQLPVKEGTDPSNYTEDDIDWVYIESIIRELEESTIRELDAYLKETGLDDYRLTDVEQELLEREPTFKEFEVGELFEVVGNKQVKSQKNIVERTDGIPFVVQSTKNNMVKCHVDRQALLDGGETVYEGNVIVLGVVSPVASYQEHEFGASQSISLRADFLNPIRGLYLVTVIRKVIESKYSYTNLPGIQKYKEDVIQLPVKPGTDEVNYTEADIDWDYMDAYVRVMEKQVIADVVDYKNEVIETTKELVHSS